MGLGTYIWENKNKTRANEERRCPLRQGTEMYGHIIKDCKKLESVREVYLGKN